LGGDKTALQLKLAETKEKKGTKTRKREQWETKKKIWVTLVKAMAISTQERVASF
jgi:hypothetical protein